MKTTIVMRKTTDPNIVAINSDETTDWKIQSESIYSIDKTALKIISTVCDTWKFDSIKKAVKFTKAHCDYVEKKTKNLIIIHYCSRVYLVGTSRACIWYIKKICGEVIL